MSSTSSDNQAGGKGPFTFHFRLVHVSYAIAMLGSTLATFGPPAVLLAVAVIAFWGYVFSRRSRPRGLIEACLAALVLSCLLYPLILLQVGVPRESSRRGQCLNNLKQIALALQNYHDTYGQFPPAYVPDRNGKPMHSWRVLLLPFLEQTPLYTKYRFDEPWDGPNNRQLLDKISWGMYQCPSDPRMAYGKGNGTWTSYVAVVGSRTAWPGSRSRKMSEISDGVANTVMVVECHDVAIPWMKPQDLQFDEALRSFTSPSAQAAELHAHQSYFFQYYGGRHVAYVDGSAGLVPYGVEPKVWSALLTVDDGAKLSDLDLRGPWHEIRQVELGNCFRLALFLFLLVLPLPWVWLGRRAIQSAQE